MDVDLWMGVCGCRLVDRWRWKKTCGSLETCPKITLRALVTCFTSLYFISVPSSGGWGGGGGVNRLMFSFAKLSPLSVIASMLCKWLRTQAAFTAVTQVTSNEDKTLIRPFLTSSSFQALVVSGRGPLIAETMSGGARPGVFQLPKLRSTRDDL